MCGIAGIVSLNNKPVDAEALGRMTDIVRHRGPDGEGFLLFGSSGNRIIDKSSDLSVYKNTSWSVGLGHRRLSIIDLTDAGCQPMSYSNGKLWIIHNGEVYNYIELRKELEAKGYSFKSQTDTEVIMAAYEEWGVNCLSKFNGMWSFAILDLRKNILFCSRDRAGVKPFYYYFDGNYFIFGSEIKQILSHQNVAKEIKTGVLFDYLVYGLLDHSEETFYQGIKQLRGAHYLEIPLGKQGYMPKPVRYWDINLNSKLTGCSDREYEEIFLNLFEDSIKLRLRSDVPIGSCLSGGLDSSGIVCVVNKLLQLENKTDLQKTFSSCFENRIYDERQFIHKITGFTKVKPYYTFPSGKKLFEEIERFVWHQDEPVISSSPYAQWNVFRLAKESGVTVMLDGQGADEIFAGYPTYYAVYLIQLLKQLRFSALSAELSGYCRVRKSSLAKIAGDLFSAYLSRRLYRIFDRRVRHEIKWLNTDFWQEGVKQSPHNKYLQMLKKENPYEGAGDLTKKLYEMFVSASLPALLRYEDKNSMAFSIESRVPFLDYRIVEFVFSAPDNQKIRNGWTKYLYRQAMKGILPEEVRLRRDKMGFVTPEDIWLTQTQRVNFENLLQTIPDNDAVFIRPELQKEFKSILEGKMPFSFTPWRWINALVWKKQLS
ncbi:MAG: asparagine synthase (glutamine-hydrolyzing) [Planctomycetes bacterium]|nr:asparagine synthase (glutamine-hydrolyzing) [Planctomycetota bacterium]